MYKKIMVAVDGSKTSIKAMKEAIKLAKTLNARIRIVHIVNVSNEQYATYLDMEIDCNAYNEAAIKSGNMILKKMQEMSSKSGIKSDTKLIKLKILGGRIEEKIIEAAKEWSANLLITGTHGYRGFTHFILGSVAEGIARISPIPVLLIRGKQE